MTRRDQRQLNQLRSLSIQRQFTQYAPGSVLVSYGQTRVLVTASVEDRVPKHIFDRNDGSGWLTAEYAMLPGATVTRNGRDRFKVSGRTMEIQRLIGRVMRSSIDLKKLGTRTITLDADVIQADGGTRVAAITGASVALRDCVAKLLKAKTISHNPLTHLISAVSVGMVNGMPVLDLNYEEDSAAEVDANIVMNDDDALIECQFSSEGHPFTRSQLQQMLDLAHEGILQIREQQRLALAQDLMTV